MNEEIILIDPHELIAHEKVSILRAVGVYFNMSFTGRFNVPILIDLHTKTILDGHHRCYAANRMRLQKVPCYQIDYLDNPKVDVHSRRPEIFIDKNSVLKMALSEGVFPEKTTRHIYTLPTFKPYRLKDLWK
jgi:hypothetical protein